CDRIADGNDRLGLFAIFNADVHPYLRELWDFQSLFRRKQVRGPPGDDAVERSLLRPHGQILAEQDLHVPAADRLDVKEALVVDVLGNEADLIAMAGEHDAQLPLRIADGDDISMPIGRDFIGEFPRPGPDDILNRTLVTGRTGSMKQVFKELV